MGSQVRTRDRLGHFAGGTCICTVHSTPGVSEVPGVRVTAAMRWFHSGRRSMAVIAVNTSAGAAAMMVLAWPWKSVRSMP